jgi:esterase/lipase superfamily enzyme
MDKRNFPWPQLLTALLFTPLLISLSGCGEAVYNQIELMPSPEVYRDGAVDPFPDLKKATFEEQTRLFYVTDREPAAIDKAQLHYANARGHLLRAGTADVRISPQVNDWDSIRYITTSAERDKKYILKVVNTDEIGVLPISLTSFIDNPPAKNTIDLAGRSFAQQINRQLSISKNKDIFIYIHGYNVDFDYSVLVSKELQHFLGYQGAFISYSWPATPNRFAYFKDAETANATRRNLRELLQFLSDHTKASRIHLIGYSAGSRLAFEVTYQIALMNKFKNGSSPAKSPRLGKVILVGSDMDRNFFGQTLTDGILDAVDHMSIYMSKSDSALNISKLFYGDHRLGQIWENDNRSSQVEQRLIKMKKLSLIDVSEAENSATGNGHWYFRSSPWASSDIFVSMLYGLPPSARGLVRPEGQSIWMFPADYPERVSSALLSN